MMQDPQVQTYPNLGQGWRLTEELIAVESEWMPEWLVEGTI